MKIKASRYSVEGRVYIHKYLNKYLQEEIKFLIEHPLKKQSIQKNDNRISLFVAQKGLCHVSKVKLDVNSMVVRNRVPKERGGTDKYHNLVLVNNEMNNLIDENDIIIINEYLERIKLDKRALNKINALRKLVGNPMI